jgi:leader peptidase (prepilin peptidase)/N-methyltransferase
MLAIIAVLGWATGALINLLADSLPTARKLQPPRCEACTAPRPWSAWSGVLEIALRSRRCAYCGTAARLRRPLVELISIPAALAIFWLHPGRSGFLLELAIAALFGLILVIDLEHRLILHTVTGPGAVMLAAIGACAPEMGVTKTLLGGALGFALILVIYLLGGVFARVAARRRGEPLDEVVFGFGDVILAGLIGLTVGWPGVLVALFAQESSAWYFWSLCGSVAVMWPISPSRMDPFSSPGAPSFTTVGARA